MFVDVCGVGDERKRKEVGERSLSMGQEGGVAGRGGG